MELLKSINQTGADPALFPVYFHDGWLDYERETNPHSQVFVCFDKSNRILAPFAVSELKFLKKANYIYIPLGLDGQRPENHAEKDFIEKFHAFLQEEKICDVIFPPPHYCNFKCIPEKVLYFELGVIGINLTGTQEDIFGNMNTTYRKQIRKAEKLGVTTVFGPEIFSEFFKLYADTHERQGLSYENEFMVRKLTEKIPDKILVGISKKDDTPEHSNLSVYDNTQAYSFWGGSAASPVVPGSNKILMWGSIKALKDLGVKKYILGGYRNPAINDDKHNGIQDFKLRFGAEVEKGYHFIKIINPVKYYLFSFALKIKSMLTGKKFYFINTSGLEIKKSK